MKTLKLIFAFIIVSTATKGQKVIYSHDAHGNRTHDVGYYYKGADGGLDAFFNTRVLADDMQLIRGASTLSGVWPNKIKVIFGILVGFKSAIKYSYLLNLKKL